MLPSVPELSKVPEAIEIHLVTNTVSLRNFLFYYFKAYLSKLE